MPRKGRVRPSCLQPELSYNELTASTLQSDSSNDELSVTPCSSTPSRNGYSTYQMTFHLNSSSISQDVTSSLPPVEQVTTETALNSMNPAIARNKVLVDTPDDPGPVIVERAVDIEWVTLNVGGVLFLTSRLTLESIPGTLLSILDESSPYYHPPTGQYWFDKNPYMFQHILDFYRGGELHFPHSLCGPSIKRELDFWGIEENNIAPCCWNTYREFAEQEETLNTLGTAFNVVEKFPKTKRKNRLFAAIFKVRSAIWYFLEDPTSSVLAQIWGTIYVFMILCSLLTMAFDTHEAFRVPALMNRTTSNETIDNPKQLQLDTTNPHPALKYIELVISCSFAADLLLRLIVCPSKIRFLKSYLNWLDIFVVVSQWATFGITLLPNFWIDKDLQLAYQVFSLLRICRVFLIFKLARHYTGLRVLILALKASAKEMILLVVIMLVGMMIFSTLIYYAEFYEKDQFRDIPTGFWWAIVTMTTVGYGDVHPQSTGGYVVGAFCAMSGMLATGLPIPIIANNFTQFYNVQKMKKRMDARKEVSLSSEMLYTMKNIFKVGGNFMDKMTDKMTEGASKVRDGVVDVAHIKNKKSPPKTGELESTPDGPDEEDGSPEGLNAVDSQLCITDGLHLEDGDEINREAHV